MTSNTYPVLTTPAEIVSEIFLRCLPVYPDCPPIFGVSSPTKLGQICSHWRQIAHSTPSLWRAIHLPHHDNIVQQVAQREVAQVWLKRSGVLPLSIIFVEGTLVVSRRSAEISLLMAYRKRWQYAYLTIHAEQATARLFEGDAPLLVQLHLSFALFDSASSGHSLRAPNLRTVLLSMAVTPDAPISMCLPWAQLTKIHLGPVALDNVVNILQQSTALVECCLCFSAEYAEHSQFTPPVLILPRLTTCIIQIVSSFVDMAAEVAPNILRLVKHMRTPALTRLQIEEVVFEGKPPLLELALKAMGCSHLEELSVADASWDTSDSEEYPPGFLGAGRAVRMSVSSDSERSTCPRSKARRVSTNPERSERCMNASCGQRRSGGSPDLPQLNDNVWREWKVALRRIAVKTASQVLPHRNSSPSDSDGMDRATGGKESPGTELGPSPWTSNASFKGAESRGSWANRVGSEATGTSSSDIRRSCSRGRLATSRFPASVSSRKLGAAETPRRASVQDGSSRSLVQGRIMRVSRRGTTRRRSAGAGYWPARSKFAMRHRWDVATMRRHGVLKTGAYGYLRESEMDRSPDRRKTLSRMRVASAERSSSRQMLPSI